MSTASVPSPVNYSPVVDELVTQQYLTAELENTKKIRILTETLEKNGSFSYKASGKYIEQKARIGEFQAAHRGELVTRTFARVNHDVTYTCPYSYYETTGTLSEEDIMYLQSADAIVDLTQSMLTRMSEDIGKGLNRKLLQSNATSNTVAGLSAATTNPIPFYGLPTLFGYGSSAIGYNPDTQASTTSAVAAGDKEVLPNVSYCGVSTHPTNAIAGVDNKLNESTSPVIVNWSSTAFPSASTTWTTNSLDVMTHMISRVARSNTPDEGADLGILTKLMYNQAKSKMRSSSSQQVVMSDGAPRAPDLGMYPRFFFPYEGVNWFFDEDQATGIVFCLNSKKLKFSVYPQRPAGMADGMIKGTTKPLFKVSQMADIDTGGHKVVAKIVAQLMANPRYHAMAYNFA